MSPRVPLIFNIIVVMTIAVSPSPTRTLRHPWSSDSE